MADIWLKIIKYLTNLYACFFAVYSFKWICKFGYFRTPMKIHITCIFINSISNTAPLMLHTKVLNFMSHLFQILTKFKYVSFTSTVWI